MTFQYSTNTLHSALQVVRLRVPSWRPVLCWMPVLRWMPVQSWMPTRKCMHWVKTHTLSTTISTIVLFARLSQVIVTAQLQPNTKMVWPHNAVEPTHHPTTTDTLKALPGNLGSWFSVCNLILTQLDEIWKTTSIFLKWKTTSILVKWKTTPIWF